MIREIHNEPARKCGFRKPGGIYLVSEGTMVPCGGLPVPVHTCPTCGGGIKFARGFTWFSPKTLFQREEACNFNFSQCTTCPVGFSAPEKAGLLWVGEKFYKTPQEWMGEAREQGVSRRIAMIPRELEIGKTWIFVAHNKGIPDSDGKMQPGIFHAFKPSRLEYILKGDESEGDIKKLERRGLTLIQLTRGE